MSKLGVFRKYIGISYINRNVVFFSIGDLGKIIDLDLNCLRKAINWPRSSLGRVLSFECRTNGIVQWHEIDRADRQTHDMMQV